MSPDVPSDLFSARRRLLRLALSAAAFSSTSRSATAALQETEQDTILAFHSAAEKGDVVALQRLILANPAMIDKKDPGGITPLGRAVAHNKLEAVKALLVGGANPNLAKPDGASPLHDAVHQKSVDIVRLLLEYKADTEVRWKDGATPLLSAVGNESEEIVRLLLAKGAKRDARTEDGRTPLLYAITVLTQQGTTSVPKAGAIALLDEYPVSLDLNNKPLREVVERVLAAAGITLSIDGASPASLKTALETLVTIKLSGGMGTSLLLLIRTARRQGQPFVFALVPGGVRIAAPGDTSTIKNAVVERAEAWPVVTVDPRYRFDRSISLAVLNAYLSRAVTHFGLLSSSPEPPTPFFEDDLRMLTTIGAKFIGRCAYAWEPPDDDEKHFRLATERATRAHEADPTLILQAAIFETAYRKVEQITVPESALAEFGLARDKRNFRYEAMLYDNGKLHNHWTQNASVPDMSKIETKLWFYYRACRYIDAGCEAIDFGQVHLMDQKDPQHLHWADLLARIRRYAATHARRRFVLCDAHTHGVTVNGRLLFDLHAFPLITKDIPDRPQKVELVANYYNTIYGRSRGGKTQSGWQCSALPYLAEIDNGGTSAKPWQPIGFPWVWGVDTISWFAHQPADERNRFLEYARRWLVGRKEDGWFQPPTRRVLAVPVNGNTMYHANNKSDACPIGFGQEDAIKAMFAAR